MTENEALNLGDKICDFLVSCGGAYNRLTQAMQWNVFFALGSGQYALKEENGEVVCFISFWRIHHADVESVAERVKPLDLVRGPVVYISEMGNKGTRKDMADIITEVRELVPKAEGVFWHRPAKGDRLYHFPLQRGKETTHGQ
jgi:hypothetical protein